MLQQVHTSTFLRPVLYLYQSELLNTASEFCHSLEVEILENDHSQVNIGAFILVSFCIILKTLTITDGKWGTLAIKLEEQVKTFRL